MNQINRVTTRLNTVLNINDIKTNMITIEDSMLIVDLSYYDEGALINLCNRAVGDYLSIHPEISAGQLSYAFVPKEYIRPTPTFACPE